MLDVKKALLTIAKNLIADEIKNSKSKDLKPKEHNWKIKNKEVANSIEEIFNSSSVDNDYLEEIIYIKAMITASYADKNIDYNEEIKIQKAIEKSKIPLKNQRFLTQEIKNPASLYEITNSKVAKNESNAKNIYFVSCAVLKEPSQKERSFLDRLAKNLNLSDNDKLEIEKKAF